MRACIKFNSYLKFPVTKQLHKLEKIVSSGLVFFFSFLNVNGAFKIFIYKNATGVVISTAIQSIHT